MEYRLKYRDIPWFIAFIVLPAKICGTMFIKWPLWIADNWKDCLLFIGIVSFLAALIVAATYFVTDGKINIVKILLKAIMGW